MARKDKQEPKAGALVRARQWFADRIAPAQDIKEADTFLFGGSTTITSMLGSGRRAARERMRVYEKWSAMEGDPIVSTALGLLVTSALGGHETSGQVIFIEKAPGIEKDKQRAKLVDEITRDLTPIFNRIAHSVAYNASAFGDAYARPYFRKGEGLVDAYVDEMVRPTLVQPYERGNRTIGYTLFSGQRMIDRLNVGQLVRMKMPRTVWVPQPAIVEKLFRMAMTEDDIDSLPVLPSLAGGSLLYQAEEAYDNLYASLIGLVSHRWMDSIDESMLGVNLDAMTSGQQESFLKSVTKMLQSSKDRAEKAVKDGIPVLERIRHILPVFGDKQLINLSPSQSGRTSNISVDDVMLHARMLAGALGVDLSMLGFADQLTGGWGDGGAFRVSAQAAERARTIRTALEAFFDDITDLHCLHKYGYVFPRNDKPWDVNFYGSISALESERQRTRTDAMGAASTIAQVIQQLKDIGAKKDQVKLFLTKQMLVDEAEAEVYAGIVEQKSEPPGGGGGGFGGFGGEDDDGGAV